MQTDTEALSIAIMGLTQVTATPSAAAVETGSFQSGAAANLAANDDSFYEVNSSIGTEDHRVVRHLHGSRALSNLQVSYAGKNSRSCAQTVDIWNWNNTRWVELDSRSVGTTEVSIANLTPGGTLSRYVSGTTGDGELRVRVRCRVSGVPFVSSGDLLQISYQRP